MHDAVPDPISGSSIPPWDFGALTRFARLSLTPLQYGSAGVT